MTRTVRPTNRCFGTLCEATATVIGGDPMAVGNLSELEAMSSPGFPLLQSWTLCRRIWVRGHSGVYRRWMMFAPLGQSLAKRTPEPSVVDLVFEGRWMFTIEPLVTTTRCRGCWFLGALSRRWGCGTLATMQCSAPEKAMMPLASTGISFQPGSNERNVVKAALSSFESASG